MADIQTEVSAHGTLLANTIDTITLGRNYQAVEVLNRSDSDTIYFCIDGRGGPAGNGVPTSGGNDTEVVLPGTAVTLRSEALGATVIKLISPGPAEYSVRGVMN